MISLSTAHSTPWRRAANVRLTVFETCRYFACLLGGEGLSTGYPQNSPRALVQYVSKKSDPSLDDPPTGAGLGRAVQPGRPDRLCCRCPSVMARYIAAQVLGGASGAWEASTPSALIGGIGLSSPGSLLLARTGRALSLASRSIKTNSSGYGAFWSNIASKGDAFSLSPERTGMPLTSLRGPICQSHRCTIIFAPKRQYDHT